MVVAYPVSLPQRPLQDGNSLQAEPNVVEYAVDVGPPMSRQRSTVAYRTFPWAMNLTSVELATFLAFFDITLRGGSATFTVTDPFMGGVITAKFVGPYAVTMMDPDTFRVVTTMRKIS